jgi:hypothetical protein
MGGKEVELAIGNSQVQFQLIAPEVALLFGFQFRIATGYELESLKLQRDGIEPEVVGGAKYILVKLLLDCLLYKHPSDRANTTSAGELTGQFVLNADRIPRAVHHSTGQLEEFGHPVRYPLRVPGLNPEWQELETL